MLNLTQKILKSHLITGELKANSDIEIKIDQTLTQDATGTMVYLQLEAMGVDRIRTDLSVSYVDHNTLQSGFENADDHQYLQSVADKYGIIYSKVGNGICHQLHLERFSKCGTTILGSDSHTPTSSAIGALAIGAGGLDVACAMAGLPFSLKCPEVINVKLINSLPKGVTAKDIILKVLNILSVKGGVNKVIEYSGPGLKSLSVPERGTICNMGAELGATSSIFPSDENTKEFLKKQNRLKDFKELKADDGCSYDREILIDLSKLEPLAACPNSPDNIKTINDLEGLKVDQILIGSCTNSSFTDFLEVASILKGKKIAKNVSFAVSFGSKNVLRMLSRCNALDDIISSGARILECTCGPCIGMGLAPKSEAISLRTFNRNFYGRSGTNSAQVYLVSPLVAAASALSGYVTNPQKIIYEKASLPESYLVDDQMFIYPTFKSKIIKGPNIKEIPYISKTHGNLKAFINLKVASNISTDHIMPAGSKILPYRSNIEKISTFCFIKEDKNFYHRCQEQTSGIIIAKENYGQGSSREHASLAPMYLGIKAVIALSYARIHKKNLINAGILPLEFSQVEDYNKLDLNDEIELLNFQELENIQLKSEVKNLCFDLKINLTDKEKLIIKSGGLLKAIKDGKIK